MDYKEQLIFKQAFPSLQTLEMLNGAAQAELGEYSPLDCHCDIPMDVAFALGYYAGVTYRGGHGDASGMSVLEMIHHDMEILIKEMISRAIEERRLVKAS